LALGWGEVRREVNEERDHADRVQDGEQREEWLQVIHGSLMMAKHPTGAMM